MKINYAGLYKAQNRDRKVLRRKKLTPEEIKRLRKLHGKEEDERQSIKESETVSGES